MKISIIIPVLNEEKAIGKVIDDIPSSLASEIIVVDNGSDDGTARIAADKGARIVYEPTKGYGQACLTGAKEAGKTDILVFLDGDYSDYPQDMDLLVKPLLNGKADLVIGSRITGNRVKGALPVHSLLGNKFSAWLLKIFFEIDITDLGPFRAISRSCFDKLTLKQRTYGFPVEMIVEAARNNCLIVEVPVRYRPRLGQSKITGTLKGSLLAGYYILNVIFRAVLYKFH